MERLGPGHLDAQADGLQGVPTGGGPASAAVRAGGMAKPSLWIRGAWARKSAGQAARLWCAQGQGDQMRHIGQEARWQGRDPMHIDGRVPQAGASSARKPSGNASTCCKSSFRLTRLGDWDRKPRGRAGTFLGP